MNKKEFVTLIDLARDKLKIRNDGVCVLLGYYFPSLLDEFKMLFRNEKVYYWGIPTTEYSKSINSQQQRERLFALDVFEQNVLCYETYKEF